MSAIVIAGLVTLLVGLAGWAISTPLARGASRSRAYLLPNADHEAFRRKQLISIRITATALSLFGAGVAIFGLVGGG
jgi:predicted benzoate:H+ symporter BenE